MPHSISVCWTFLYLNEQINTQANLIFNLNVWHWWWEFQEMGAEWPEEAVESLERLFVGLTLQTWKHSFEQPQGSVNNLKGLHNSLLKTKCWNHFANFVLDFSLHFHEAWITKSFLKFSCYLNTLTWLITAEYVVQNSICLHCNNIKKLLTSNRIKSNLQKLIIFVHLSAKSKLLIYAQGGNLLLV